MDIINSYSNVINSSFEMVCIYSINSSLDVLLCWISSVVDLEAKVFRMGQSHWKLLVAS